MRTRLSFLAGVLVAGSLACASFGTLTSGGTRGLVLPDPTVGLDALDNYQASLTLAFDGQRAGASAQTRESYTQSVWRSPRAVFTSYAGLDQDGEPLAIVTGTVGEAYYVQEGDLPCIVQWGSPPVTDYSPAGQLPPVGKATMRGREAVNGTPTFHYVLDSAAFEFGDGVTATGDLWLAEDGGYVVKYSLGLDAGESYLGEGSSGASRVEYELTQVNARTDVVYPDGCQAIYTGLPVLPEAVNLARLPSMTTYSAETDLPAARSFYEEEMAGLGWELDATHESDPDRLGLLYSHPDDGLQALISIRREGSAVRVIASVFGLSTTAPAEITEPGPSEQIAANAPVRVMGSLGLLLGSDSQPSVLPSYHLEVRHQAPLWTGSALGTQQDALEADVQGPNIHFTDRVTSAGGSLTTEEAYLIGDQEYRVEGGTLSPGIGMSRLTWVMWPLDLTAILGAGVSGATLTGTEALEGRTAEVYDLQGAGVPQPAGGLGGLTLPVTATSGRVWVDQQTGALLKSVLDFEMTVVDTDGQPHGTASGHLEIEVTRVGQVEVSLPGN